MATRPARPWWVWLATASFAAYFVFLHLSYFYARESMGMSTIVSVDGVHVERITQGAAAARSGFLPGDRLISMDDVAISDGNDFTIASANVPIGQRVEWVIERGGTPMTLATPPLARRWVIPNTAYLLAFSGFALSLVLGALVLWRGPAVPSTWLGGWLLLSLGCASLPLFNASFATEWRMLAAPIQALMLPAALSSLSTHLLLLVYCSIVTRSGWSRTQLMAACVPGAAVTVYVAAYVVLTLYAPADAVQLPVPPWLNVAGPLSYPVYMFAVAWMAYAAMRRAPDITERRRARVLLVGLMLGAAGCLVIALALGLAPTGGALPSNRVLVIAIPVFALMPVAFAYATLRHRLFDIRLIIRQGLQYALTRGAIGAVVPAILLILAADVALHRSDTLESIIYERGFAYVIALMIVLLIYREREAWMTALDRRFFRERYAAQQILRDVVADVGGSADFESAAKKVIGRIDSALHPVVASIMIKPRQSTAFAAVATSPGGHTPPLPSSSPITQVVRALGKPVSAGSLGLGDIADLVVPIAIEPNSDEALLVLGPRKSEEPYSQEDRDLLSAIATSLRLLMGRNSPEQMPTVSSTQLGPARLLAGRYRIDRPIGEGGMGTVYAATDETLQRQIAIKVIKDQHLAGDALARFQREARTAASLSHPHIVTVHDFGTDDAGAPFLVMELLEGESLRSAIKRGPMSIDRASAIIAGLAAAIDAAHAKGIVHRDLKPENVFLIATTHAKILDYGIAKAIESKTTFATPGVVGTLAYMAPEQAGGGDASPAWDIWALSVIAFELLTGHHPFNGGLPVSRAVPLKTLLPHASDAIAATIDRALSLSPSDRPTSATELLQSLAR